MSDADIPNPNESRRCDCCARQILTGEYATEDHEAAVCADCAVALIGQERDIAQRQLGEMREITRERPDASIYLSVKNGRARVAFPGGGFKIVDEGKAIRIWPHYRLREEPRV